MTKDYTIQGTSKIQREKYAADALALSSLGAPEPSEETMALIREYIDGKREVSEILQLTLERYRANPAHV
jgi:hypothetical protein